MIVVGARHDYLYCETDTGFYYQFCLFFKQDSEQIAKSDFRVGSRELLPRVHPNNSSDLIVNLAQITEVSKDGKLQALVFLASGNFDLEYHQST